VIYVCIPAHDEAATIGVLLWKTRKVLNEFGRDFRLVVHDDASGDDTAQVLERYMRTLPLTVLRSEQRIGYGRSVETLLADLPPTFTTPEIRIDCPDDKKFQIAREATAYFRERYEIIDVDGVRVQFPDGWGLIRASNTQPVLVLRFEASSPQRLDAIRGEVEAAVEQARAAGA